MKSKHLLKQLKIYILKQLDKPLLPSLLIKPNMKPIDRKVASSFNFPVQLLRQTQMTTLRIN